MKSERSYKKITALALGLCLTISSVTVSVVAASDSLLSVTEEAQIRPIQDGSGKYLMKSDGFYCLKEDGGKDAAAAVHYFDEMKIDGTVLDGFYYHDESGCYRAESPRIVKISNLTCMKPDENGDTVEQSFDGYYMVNNLGKLTAAPQVRYIDNLTMDGITFNGYYYFDENGRMVTETGNVIQWTDVFRNILFWRYEWCACTGGRNHTGWISGR